MSWWEPREMPMLHHRELHSALNSRHLIRNIHSIYQKGVSQVRVGSAGPAGGQGWQGNQVAWVAETNMEARKLEA